MDVHISIFTDVLMACMFVFMPVISWSLFSVLFFQESQSVIYMSGPGLYKWPTLYW